MKKLYPVKPDSNVENFKNTFRIIFLKLIIGLSVFLMPSAETCKAQLTAYTFVQSNSTYTSISGETVLATAQDNTATLNLNSVVAPVTLPFAFNFNGTSFTDLNVSSNGFVTFGSVAPSSFYTSPISGTTAYQGAISAWGRDISSFFNINNRRGKISYGVVGTAPNREFVIQWTDFRPNSSTVTTIVYSFSFQIRLEETTNKIRIVYDAGSYLAGSTTVNGTAEIGLRGASNAEFNNRTNSTAVAFSSSSAGTGNNSSQAFNTVGNIPGVPPANLTYTWTPPSCYIPTNVAVNNTTSTSADVSWAASSSSPSGYDLYYSTSATPPTAATVPTVTNFSGTSYQITGLNPLTTYFVWVRSNCGSGNVSVWSSDIAVFTTTCSNPPAAPTVNGATVSPNQQATLTAAPSSSTNYSWYDAPAGGNLLFTGNPFVTPALTATTNYYVSAFSGTTGTPAARSYSTGGLTGIGIFNTGILFDALSYFVLESVTLYPISSNNASGTIIIDVIDSNGNVINTKTANVVGAPSNAPVPQVITLNFPIFPGTNYKLRPRSFTGISGLMFESNSSGNYPYPYTVQNLLNITASTLTAAPTNTPRTNLYYYFYDWKIGSKCESSRSMATANVNSTLSVSEAEAKDKIEIYPNPFSDVVTINRPELISTLNIIDASGKVVMQNVKAESKIILNHLLSGVYIADIQMKNGTRQSIKLTKK